MNLFNKFFGKLNTKNLEIGASETKHAEEVKKLLEALASLDPNKVHAISVCVILKNEEKDLQNTEEEKHQVHTFLRGDPRSLLFASKYLEGQTVECMAEELKHKQLSKLPEGFTKH